MPGPNPPRRQRTDLHERAHFHHGRHHHPRPSRFEPLPPIQEVHHARFRPVLPHVRVTRPRWLTMPVWRRRRAAGRRVPRRPMPLAGKVLLAVLAAVLVASVLASLLVPGGQVVALAAVAASTQTSFWSSFGIAAGALLAGAAALFTARLCLSRGGQAKSCAHANALSNDALNNGQGSSHHTMSTQGLAYVALSEDEKNETQNDRQVVIATPISEESAPLLSAEELAKASLGSPGF